jgi:mannose-6-phosphate isomerase
MRQQINHPIKLQPMRVKRTYTGGKLLDDMQSIIPSKDGNMPEEWVASTITSRFDINPDAGLSIIEEGPERGRFLRDLIAADSSGMLGVKHVESFGESLGFLAKLIDSDKRLNIQTHPDNAKAREYFNSPFGKTEAWYVIDTRIIDGQQPYIYLGFKPGITKENWITWVTNQDIPSLENALHKIPIQKGDVFFVDSGMPHAIGCGTFLAEIQEPTDYTFRVEKIVDGDALYPEEVYHQGIGYEKMFECFHYDGYSLKELLSRTKVEPIIKDSSNGHELIKLLGAEQTTCFAMDKLLVWDSCTLSPVGTFRTAVVLNGKGTIRHGESFMEVTKSNELFFPISDIPLIIESQQQAPLEILIFYPPVS